MRGQSLKGLIEYEAKRRPEVKDLLDRVMELTEEEIDKVDVPLPWYRQALRQVRQERRLEAGTTFGTVPDVSGYVAEWIGEVTFVKVSEGMQLEVKPNTLLFFPDNGGVWIESTYSNTIDPRFIILPRRSEKMARTEYIRLYKARLIEKLG